MIFGGGESGTRGKAAVAKAGKAASFQEKAAPHRQKTALFPRQTRRAHRRENGRVRKSFPRIGLCIYCTTQKSMAAISNMDKRPFALLDTLRDRRALTVIGKNGRRRGICPRHRDKNRRRKGGDDLPSLPFVIVFCTDVFGFFDARNARCFDFFILLYSVPVLRASLRRCAHSHACPRIHRSRSS